MTFHRYVSFLDGNHCMQQKHTKTGVELILLDHDVFFFGPGSILTFLEGFRGVKLLLSRRESQKNFAPCCSSANHWVTVASHRPRSMLMRVWMPMFPKTGAVRRRKPNHITLNRRNSVVQVVLLVLENQRLHIYDLKIVTE